MSVRGCPPLFFPRLYFIYQGRTGNVPLLLILYPAFTMLSRFFAPSAFARLFDPMPLPRRVRLATQKVRAGKNLAPVVKTPSIRMKKIPLYR